MTLSTCWYWKIFPFFFFLFFPRHVMVGLHWVQTIIKKWWPELSKKEKRLRDSRSEDRWTLWLSCSVQRVSVKCCGPKNKLKYKHSFYVFEMARWGKKKNNLTSLDKSCKRNGCVSRVQVLTVRRGGFTWRVFVVGNFFPTCLNVNVVYFLGILKWWSSG